MKRKPGETYREYTMRHAQLMYARKVNNLARKLIARGYEPKDADKIAGLIARGIVNPRDFY